MRKKLLALLLSITLVVPYFSLNLNKAHAFSSIETVSNNSSDNVFGPAISPDASGYIHAVWFETFPTGNNNPNPGIYYSRWNGDTWSTPDKISQNAAYADYPTIATDTSNNVYTVWTDNTYGNGFPRVAYRTRTPGNNGAWSSISVLPLANGQDTAQYPNIAIDNNTNPNVVFDENTPPSTDRLYWTKLSSGNWSTPTLIGTDEDGNTLNDVSWSSLKSDGSGNLHVAYWSISQGIFYKKYDGNSWSTTVKLSSVNEDTQYVRLAVTPGGEVFVAWFSSTGNLVQERHTVSGTWQSTTTLATGANFPLLNSQVIGITTDSKERAYVGWGQPNGNGKVNVVYKRFANGSWSGSNTIRTGVTDPMTPVVIGDKWDNQHFMWAEKNDTTGHWEMKYVVAEGSTQNVGTGGGTVTSNPFNINEAQLVIPSGALSQTTNIAIQVGPVPDTVNQNQVTIPRAFTFRPGGTTFSTPATAKIYYSNSEINGADPGTLAPWFWNSQTNQWEAQSVTSVDTVNHILNVSLSHFSLYGISAKLVNLTWGDKPGSKVIPGDDVEYKFSLAYQDGSTFIMPSSPDDLIINLKDSDGNILDTDHFQKGQMTFDKAKGQFHGKLHSKKLSGDYTLEVVLRGNPIGTLPIIAK